MTVSFDNPACPPAGEATGTDLFSALHGGREFGWAIGQATAHPADRGSSRGLRTPIEGA